MTAGKRGNPASELNPFAHRDPYSFSFHNRAQDREDVSRDRSPQVLVFHSFRCASRMVPLVHLAISSALGQTREKMCHEAIFVTIRNRYIGGKVSSITLNTGVANQ